MFLPSLTSHQEFSGRQLVFSAALSASVPLRSSLITDDKASGLIPCSQSRTQIDSVSISKPVFKILEISSSTSMVSLTAFRLAEAAAPAPLPLAMERRSPRPVGEGLTRNWSARRSAPLSHRAAALTPPRPRPRRPSPAPSRRARTPDRVDLNLEPRSLARNVERGVSVRIHPTASTPLAGSRTAVRRDWPVASPRPAPWLAGEH